MGGRKKVVIKYWYAPGTFAFTMPLAIWNEVSCPAITSLSCWQRLTIWMLSTEMTGSPSFTP